VGPLAGIKVLELAAIGPGPMCGMLLADLGADVVRIDRLEPSGLGIPIERRFEITSRGRRSIAIDLKQPAGVGAVLRLIAGADVLIEGFRPGVAERLGLGPEVCRAHNPRLVYGRVTGFGQDGPLAGAAGHDLNYIALTGALHAIGPPEGPPVPPLNLIGDYGGGALYLAVAAMIDGAASLMTIFYGMSAAGMWDDRRGANLLDGGAPYYSVYRTSDGRYVSIAAIENKFFAELVVRLGLDRNFVTRQNDRTVWPELRRQLAEIFQTKTRDEWCEVLEGTDACFAPVLTISEAARHPHATTRQMFVEIDGVPQPAPAPRFNRTPTAASASKPQPGQHTRELLGDAGFAEAEIADLLQAGVVR
jgi:alpha-methylacyl-CoA racemase